MYSMSASSFADAISSMGSRGVAVTSAEISCHYDGTAEITIVAVAGGGNISLDRALGGGWVPVSQRLPPSDDSVLACLRGDVREASYWGPDDGWSVEPSPSHWMPMPSPPLETKKRRKA